MIYEVYYCYSWNFIELGLRLGGELFCFPTVSPILPCCVGLVDHALSSLFISTYMCVGVKCEQLVNGYLVFPLQVLLGGTKKE